MYIAEHMLIVIGAAAILLDLYAKKLIGYPVFVCGAAACLWTFNCHGRLMDGETDSRAQEKLRAVRMFMFLCGAGCCWAISIHARKLILFAK